jgi:hypothetical protein
MGSFLACTEKLPDITERAQSLRGLGSAGKQVGHWRIADHQHIRMRIEQDTQRDIESAGNADEGFNAHGASAALIERDGVLSQPDRRRQLRLCPASRLTSLPEAPPELNVKPLHYAWPLPVMPVAPVTTAPSPRRPPDLGRRMGKDYRSLRLAAPCKRYTCDRSERRTASGMNAHRAGLHREARWSSSAC